RPHADPAGGSRTNGPAVSEFDWKRGEISKARPASPSAYQRGAKGRGMGHIDSRQRNRLRPQVRIRYFYALQTLAHGRGVSRNRRRTRDLPAHCAGAGWPHLGGIATGRRNNGIFYAPGGKPATVAAHAADQYSATPRLASRMS